MIELEIISSIAKTFKMLKFHFDPDFMSLFKIATSSLISLSIEG